MNKLKTILYCVFFTVLGSVIIIVLYPRIHPLAGIKQTLNSAQIKSRAQEIADELNFPTDSYRITTEFVANRELIRQAQQILGLEKSKQILREELPGYFWQIRWRKIDDSILAMQEKSEEEIRTAILGDLSVKLDMHGNLFELTSDIADSIRLPFIDASKAKMVAESFVKRFSSFKQLQLDTLVEMTSRSVQEPEVKSAASAQLKIEDEIKTIKSNRTDYQYKYSTMDPHLNDKIQVSILVSGNIVTNFDVKYIIPDEHLSNRDFVAAEVVKVIAWILYIILFLVIGFKRMRAYEIGFTMAIILGLFVAVNYGLEFYLQMQGDSRWEILLAILIGPLFIGGAFIIIWAVSESLGREVWKEKFTSLDLLTNGHFLHSKIGEGILRGVGMGVAMLAGWLLLL